MAQLGISPREVDKMKMPLVRGLEICMRLDAERRRMKQSLDEFYAKGGK